MMKVIYFRDDFTQKQKERIVELERINYEKINYEKIINFMINNNQMDTEEYGKFYARYILTKIDFNNKKNIFQKEIVKSLEPGVKKWIYDFTRGELKIEI